jgi:hypothetical protein
VLKFAKECVVALALGNTAYELSSFSDKDCLDSGLSDWALKFTYAAEIDFNAKAQRFLFKCTQVRTYQDLIIFIRGGQCAKVRNGMRSRANAWKYWVRTVSFSAKDCLVLE